MIKRKYLIVVTGLSLFALSACGSGHTDNADMQLSGTSSSSVSSYRITPHKCNIQTAARQLFDDYTENVSIDTNSNTDISSIDIGNGSLTVGPGIVDYYKDDSSGNAGSVFEMLFINQPSDDQLAPAQYKDITDKWEEKITDLCEIEDSQVLQPQLVYKMSAADLKNSYASYNDNSLENLEIDDGEYIGIDYSLTFDDIPLMNDTEPGEGYNADIWAAQACYIHLVIFDDRIVNLSCNGLFSYTKDETNSIISKDEAVSIIRQEQDNVISDSDPKISDCYLEYVEVPDWDSQNSDVVALVPYWCVIQTYKEEGEETRTAARVNAFTGGELSYGE